MDSWGITSRLYKHRHIPDFLHPVAMDEEEIGDAVYGSDAEGDETVTLSEIVAGREVALGEEELWALCRECCLTLEFVHSTQELFQSLVITPETVAFDREGNVCFLDLDAGQLPLLAHVCARVCG